MAIDVCHGRLRPPGLENIVGLFFSQVALYHSFLVHVGDGIVGSDRSGEVLEGPIGGTCQVRHGLLLFEMPVDQVAEVGFAPVTIFGDPCCSSEEGGIAFLLVRTNACFDLLQNLVG